MQMILIQIATFTWLVLIPSVPQGHIPQGWGAEKHFFMPLFCETRQNLLPMCGTCFAKWPWGPFGQHPPDKRETSVSPHYFCPENTKNKKTKKQKNIKK
jgi:hypothetical protein